MSANSHKKIPNKVWNKLVQKLEKKVTGVRQRDRKSTNPTPS
jgi:hypothetical protein